MLSGKTLENFAKLCLKIGVNLQKGQGLEIACPIEKSEVAHVLAKTAYELGAKIVNVRWEDETLDKINYTFAQEEALSSVPKWFIDSKNYLVENGFCYVAIASDDPSAFKDVPADKISAVIKAKSKALKKFSDNVMANKIRWCVVSVPTLSWAKQVFPKSKNPEKDLSEAIEKTMRLNELDPVKAWEEHIQTLNKRTEFLNDKNFDKLIFKSKSGTNLSVGLAVDHVWLSAQETAKDNVKFIANMPTEEIFTCPHRLKVDGVLKSALPLCDNGQIIDGFTIQFKKGKIVGYTAEKGYERLKGLIETDSGTERLGEVALVGKNSPIAKCGILFYNTLFDENASCHLAIGKAYPTTIKNGDTLSLSQLKKLGANDSTEHVDFMIGTDDLSVVGVDKHGNKTTLFENGDWVI